MLAYLTVGVALVLPALSNHLQFFEQPTTNHFQQTDNKKIGVSNVPDLVSRALWMGVFVKGYSPPQFLTFSEQAPSGNLFIYIANYEGEQLSGSRVSFDVMGNAKISDILSGTDSPTEASSSLSDLAYSHFDSHLKCASHCSHLAQALCGQHKDHVVARKKMDVDPNFVSKYNIPKNMAEEFVLELQFLLKVTKNNPKVVFFGVSSYNKVSPKMRGEAKRILEKVISKASRQMTKNSVTEVLTIGPNDAFHHSNSNVAHSQRANRKLLQTPNGATWVYLPGEFLAQVWVSVGGLFVVAAVAYYLAYMDYTQDSVLYTTMNPNLADRRR